MHNYHDIGLKCSKYIPIHYKTFNFEKLYPKVFWCLLFAQLYGFLCSSLGFSMFSSLYSLISTFQELSRECRELIKESKDLNWNIFGAFQAYVMFMVHIQFNACHYMWKFARPFTHFLSPHWLNWYQYIEKLNYQRYPLNQKVQYTVL